VVSLAVALGVALGTAPASSAAGVSERSANNLLYGYVYWPNGRPAANVILDIAPFGFDQYGEYRVRTTSTGFYRNPVCQIWSCQDVQAEILVPCLNDTDVNRLPANSRFGSGFGLSRGGRLDWHATTAAVDPFGNPTESWTRFVTGILVNCG
jgi:hypothetical protein